MQMELFTPDQPVSMEELHELWATLDGRDELWNGMTSHYLRERYGDRLYHIAGTGWFVRNDDDTLAQRLSFFATR